MTQVNIAQAKAHLSELVQKALLGEEVIIARDNKPQVRKFGSGKGSVLYIADDFDAPLDDFADYM